MQRGSKRARLQALARRQEGVQSIARGEVPAVPMRPQLYNRRLQMTLAQCSTWTMKTSARQARALVAWSQRCLSMILDSHRVWAFLQLSALLRGPLPEVATGIDRRLLVVQRRGLVFLRPRVAPVQVALRLT